LTRVGAVAWARGGVARGAGAEARAGLVAGALAGPGGVSGRGDDLRLVVGVGCSLGCSAEELAALVEAAHQGIVGDVVAVATVDRRAHEPCVVALTEALGVPLRTFPAGALAVIKVPTPSAVVRHHVGTPSVAEAAALFTARGVLVVPKIRSPHATCAIAKEL
jgi:cobalamin biosynthesis protein CbiG